MAGEWLRAASKGKAPTAVMNDPHCRRRKISRLRIGKRAAATAIFHAFDQQHYRVAVLAVTHAVIAGHEADIGGQFFRGVAPAIEAGTCVKFCDDHIRTIGSLQDHHPIRDLQRPEWLGA